MKEKSRLTISFEMLKNPHIELHDKIVYSVIATLMVDDLLEITFDELALKCGFKRRQIIKSVKSLIALKLLADHPSLRDDSVLRVFRKGEVRDLSSVTIPEVENEKEATGNAEAADSSGSQEIFKSPGIGRKTRKKGRDSAPEVSNVSSVEQEIAVLSGKEETLSDTRRFNDSSSVSEPDSSLESESGGE